jgi:hypothetical protein
VLLNRSPNWLPALRILILVVCVAVGLAIAVVPRLRGRLAMAVAAVGVIAACAGPAAYAVNTIGTPESGAIPSAGPAVAGTLGGPGGFAGPGGFGGAGGPGGRTFPGATGGRFPRAGTGTGQVPGAGGFGRFRRGATGATGGAPSFAGGAGGFLNATTPGKALTAALQSNASQYKWVAAITRSNSAAGYQLASGDPVMAIGGFNGTDPAPTLAQFEAYVRAGEIHYYISSGGFGGGGGGGFGGGGGGGGFGGGAGGGSGGDASKISSWVASHFTAKTVDGTTIYDLTQPRTTSGTAGTSTASS